MEVNMVKELLFSDGSRWDQNKLNKCFCEVDVAEILKILVDMAGLHDYIARNYTINRFFSVRLAYHLKQQIKRDSMARASTFLVLLITRAG
jgi:hypothetical protein